MVTAGQGARVRMASVQRDKRNPLPPAGRTGSRRPGQPPGHPTPRDPDPATPYPWRPRRSWPGSPLESWDRHRTASASPAPPWGPAGKGTPAGPPRQPPASGLELGPRPLLPRAGAAMPTLGPTPYPRSHSGRPAHRCWHCLWRLERAPAGWLRGWGSKGLGFLWSRVPGRGLHRIDTVIAAFACLVPGAAPRVSHQTLGTS